MLANAAQLRVCAALHRKGCELWALRGYFTPIFNGCLAQKALAVIKNQLYLRAARRKYRYLFMKFKGINTFTKVGINRNEKSLHNNPVIYLSVYLGQLHGLLCLQYVQGFLVEAFMFFIFVHLLCLQKMIWIWGVLAPFQASNAAVGFFQMQNLPSRIS